MALPTDSKARKALPVYSGVVAYFPDALVEVARVSQAGNDQHNPGQPLHWAREKSTDHEDCIQRHTIDALKATSREERLTHLASRAWRALAALQLEAEPQQILEGTYGVEDIHTPVAYCCRDCGVDLAEGQHSYACLAGKYRGC